MQRHALGAFAASLSGLGVGVGVGVGVGAAAHPFLRLSLGLPKRPVQPITAPTTPPASLEAELGDVGVGVGVGVGGAPASAATAGAVGGDDAGRSARGGGPQSLLMVRGAVGGHAAAGNGGMGKHAPRA